MWLFPKLKAIWICVIELVIRGNIVHCDWTVQMNASSRVLCFRQVLSNRTKSHSQIISIQKSLGENVTIHCNYDALTDKKAFLAVSSLSGEIALDFYHKLYTLDFTETQRATLELIYPNQWKTDAKYAGKANKDKLFTNIDRKRMSLYFNAKCQDNINFICVRIGKKNESSLVETQLRIKNLNSISLGLTFGEGEKEVSDLSYIVENGLIRCSYHRCFQNEAAVFHLAMVHNDRARKLENGTDAWGRKVTLRVVNFKRPRCYITKIKVSCFIRGKDGQMTVGKQIHGPPCSAEVKLLVGMWCFQVLVIWLLIFLLAIMRVILKNKKKRLSELDSKLSSKKN